MATNTNTNNTGSNNNNNNAYATKAQRTIANEERLRAINDVGFFTRVEGVFRNLLDASREQVAAEVRAVVERRAAEQQNSNK